MAKCLSKVFCDMPKLSRSSSVKIASKLTNGQMDKQTDPAVLDLKSTYCIQPAGKGYRLVMTWSEFKTRWVINVMI